MYLTNIFLCLFYVLILCSCQNSQIVNPQPKELLLDTISTFANEPLILITNKNEIVTVYDGERPDWDQNIEITTFDSTGKFKNLKKLSYARYQSVIDADIYPDGSFGILLYVSTSTLTVTGNDYYIFRKFTQNWDDAYALRFDLPAQSFSIDNLGRTIITLWDLNKDLGNIIMLGIDGNIECNDTINFPSSTINCAVAGTANNVVIGGSTWNTTDKVLTGAEAMLLQGNCESTISPLKIYPGIGNNNEYIWRIFSYSNGHLLFSASSSPAMSSSGTYYNFLYAVTATGEVVNKLQISNIRNFYYSKDERLFVWQKDSLVISELDQSFQKIKQIEIDKSKYNLNGSLNVYNVKLFSNGDLLVYGGYVHKISDSAKYSGRFFSRIDNVGEIKW